MDNVFFSVNVKPLFQKLSAAVCISNLLPSSASGTDRKAQTVAVVKLQSEWTEGAEPANSEQTYL